MTYKWTVTIASSVVTSGFFPSHVMRPSIRINRELFKKDAKRTSMSFMKRGNTGLRRIAITGTWGHTSGTATVAGKCGLLDGTSSSPLRLDFESSS